METKSTLYNEFPLFLKRYFSYKVQKISLNAGFTCPNRDGNKGVGGCTYCNNQTFNPDYCRTEKSITRQLEEGKQFFAHKYPEMKYLAYFQAYTNTYGELEDLKRKYEEALSADGVVGLVIGTRPDCMPDSLLDYLVKKSYSAAYGARNLRRLIQKELEDAIASRIIDSWQHPVARLDASSDGEQLVLSAL